MTRDLRRYARQTTTRLIIGALLLTLLVGGGLILNFYGAGALAMGLLCFIAGLTPIVLIITILFLIEWIVEHERNR